MIGHNVTVTWRPSILYNFLEKAEMKPGLSLALMVKSYLVKAKMGEPGEVFRSLVAVGMEGVSIWSVNPRAQARFLSMKG